MTALEARSAARFALGAVCTRETQKFLAAARLDSGARVGYFELRKELGGLPASYAN
jgi:hypothetical protein